MEAAPPFDFAASPPRGRWLDRLLWALVALGAWSVLVLSAWLHPDARGFGTHQQLGLAPCSFHASTGIPCPGCGLTTAFALMAHLSPLAALRVHLMGPPLFLLTLWAALYAPRAAWRGVSLTGWMLHRASLPVLGFTAGAGVLTFALRCAHVLPVAP